MMIVSGRIKNDINVKFLDNHGYIKEHITYNAFKKGEVKNPYDITVLGVGYIGVGKHYVQKKGEKAEVEYTTWCSMLDRCYRNKEKYPAYCNKCSVCDEWLNYQIFADWYERNKYETKGRLHLDKDILFPGNTVYSPEKCLLVPQRINMLFTTHRPNKYGLPEGISLTDNGKYGVSYQGKSLGAYKTLEEACFIHIKKKEEVIKQVADEYRQIIPKKIYDILQNYKVEVDRYMKRIV